ncbi:hypothetical protein GF1_29420 [Desulfolithobacter dissulfuricans]|uniref:Uncharacterized protein n=1 Tax=Desulfolithobacter dissulfuricans TaxID=2795293 RepID=A0A915UB30_9BACT|nr:hypothetical protein [Desulfolithobacter dissulfuricans]BCO10566.1 hypothetical protein GF1_29420 [Desulfolithobacter dissulfuricans]
MTEETKKKILETAEQEAEEITRKASEEAKEAVEKNLKKKSGTSG